jgi:hypothetical protein
MNSEDYFICSNCGATVPSRALACPECGSDDRTGWSEDTLYDGLDLPDLDEPATTPKPSPMSPMQSRLFILIVAIISLLVFLLFFLH